MSEDIVNCNNMMAMLEEKIVDLEARGRRGNLIIHGIPEGESGPECKRMVQGFFRDQLKLGGAIPVQRAHRLGTDQRRGPRPVIVLFVDYSDKERVKEARKMLPTGIFMTDDFAWEVRMARKDLQAEAKERQENGQRAWVAYPARLIVNGQEVRRITPRYAPRQRPYVQQQNNGASQHSRGGSDRPDRGSGQQQMMEIDDGRQPRADSAVVGLPGPFPVGSHGASRDAASGVSQGRGPAPGGTQGLNSGQS